MMSFINAHHFQVVCTAFEAVVTEKIKTARTRKFAYWTMRQTLFHMVYTVVLQGKGCYDFCLVNAQLLPLRYVNSIVDLYVLAFNSAGKSKVWKSFSLCFLSLIFGCTFVFRKFGFEIVPFFFTVFRVFFHHPSYSFPCSVRLHLQEG